VNGCALHVSDLHRGSRESTAVDDALVALALELRPDVVLATGDLGNRGRVAELERAKSLLERLGAPVVAVPGNHDLPYTFPGRFTHPSRAFESVFGTAEPELRSDALVVCGLDSTWPARQQGGRLSESQLERVARVLADAPPDALRIVALHHHLAGAPWRASRKLPLKHRDQVLAAFGAAGAELVASGHIHQSSAVERREFVAGDEPPRASLVLATAPGLGRPRPRRTGEAHGLHVYRWSESELVVETHVWDGAGFAYSATRRFPRSV
jgi:3',5'-cyclic AMP phosphodiesterase CpdA